MKIIALTTGCLLACTPVSAEPDEATKRAALLWAYQANGNSMISWTAWDYEKKQRIDLFPRDVTPQEKPKTKQGTSP